MTMRRDGHPSADYLLVAPQLAVLSLLADALHLSAAALDAAHPELLTGEGLDAPPVAAAAWVALNAQHLMRALTALLVHYRVSLHAPRCSSAASASAVCSPPESRAS